MKTALVYNFDKNYIDYAITSLTSLCNNYTNGTIDVFCFVTPDMIDLQNDFIKTVKHQDKLRIKFVYSKRFFNLNLEKVKRGSWTSHITNHALQKCFIADELKDYDRAIYIDPDTLFLQDFNILLNYPMFNKFLAVQEYTDINYMMYKTKNLPAFNSGVWIADLNYFREIDLAGLTESYIESNPNMPWLDQEILNKFMLDKWHALPLSFNIFSWTSYDYNWSRFNSEPVIVHFVSSPKPLSKDFVPENKWGQMFIDLHSEIMYNKNKGEV